MAFSDSEMEVLQRDAAPELAAVIQATIQCLPMEQVSIVFNRAQWALVCEALKEYGNE